MHRRHLRRVRARRFGGTFRRSPRNDRWRPGTHRGRRSRPLSRLRGRRVVRHEHLSVVLDGLPARVRTALGLAVLGAALANLRQTIGLSHAWQVSGSGRVMTAVDHLVFSAAPCSVQVKNQVGGRDESPRAARRRRKRCLFVGGLHTELVGDLVEERCFRRSPRSSRVAAPTLPAHARIRDGVHSACVRCALGMWSASVVSAPFTESDGAPRQHGHRGRLWVASGVGRGARTGRRDQALEADVNGHRSDQVVTRPTSIEGIRCHGAPCPSVSHQS